MDVLRRTRSGRTECRSNEAGREGRTPRSVRRVDKRDTDVVWEKAQDLEHGRGGKQTL